MASYIKGNPVANATSYELFEKAGSIYTSLKTASEINFNLDEISLSGGSHTLVVKAKADGYEDSDYSNEVIYNAAITLPLIDISMVDGVNVGTGGATYKATTYGDAVFVDNKLKSANGTGYATIPIDFITTKTSEFTAFFVFDSWTKGSTKYGRFFRFSSDVPNCYLNDPTVTNGNYSIRFKLLNNFTTGVADYVNDSILFKESGSEYYYIPVSAGEKLAIAVRCDGTRYSFWKDGILVATTLCTNSTPSPVEWGQLQIGDQPQAYSLGSFECSKIQVWDSALSDEEMAVLIG